MRNRDLPKSRYSWKTFSFLVAFISLLLLSQGTAQAGRWFTTDFMLEDCDFKNRGRNPYWVLVPGYQMILAGEDEGEEVVVQIDVLNETETITYMTPIGVELNIEARVVKETEWIDDELVEESWNWFAICKQTNAVYYFGEDVDVYEDGGVSHEGAWRAGEDGALPGLIMPGTVLLGSMYYQEIAPDVALDRAKHTAQGFYFSTEAGNFHNCILVRETTPLEPGEVSIKIYAPGVGLVYDDGIELVEYGYPATSAND